MSADRPFYPEVNPQPRLPEIEERVLARWQREQTFRASVAQRPTGVRGDNEYVFYDGPPFANGLPHYGHLITSYIKDIVPRYQTMQGRRVERRFGWDCHGLPAEMAAEKELGVSGRQQIIDYGIDRFNDYCRTSVFKYAREWEVAVTRAARWVDFENDYKTLDLSYMESTLWGLKELWKRGLLYEGYRVMPYSWAAQTPLSNHETRLDDAYRERQDPAITVRFALEDPIGGDRPTDLLAWTTTPWTLPGNLALAVGPDIDYAVFALDGRQLVVGEAAVAKYERELEGAERVASLPGHALVGRRYLPLFPFFANTDNAFTVLAASFVNTEEGTGIVHLAPGFGEDDMEACKAANIPVVCPVDDEGKFTSEVPPWEGMQVFDANREIIRDLSARDALVKEESYLHNYPHCWRTDTPLIYKALNSWYVKVTDIRDRMVELNQQINWIPEHIRDGLFGRWLENARDWSISRNRFWGTPIPIWKSDDPEFPRIDVYGSLDELEADFGVRPTDLHRPTIDALTRPNPDDPSGRSTMRRVPEVLDVWFDSGSMFFAQMHYPFENRERFENHFPADFITEYSAQTRGWFYVMHVLSTALFDRPPFRNCLCHGVIQAEDGKKLSKRLRNYPEVDDMMNRVGSDALRWYLVSSPLMRGGELRIDREGKSIVESVRLVVLPIWNAYSFFCLYANADGIRASVRSDSTHILDRYLLAKTHALVTGIEADLDAYDLAGACAQIFSFIDALNNWYIRRSRPRFWRAGGAEDTDKRDAYDTLFTVLSTLCKAVAPLLPMLSEEIYAGLTAGRDAEEATSVHLQDWPDSKQLPADPGLVSAMDQIRDACSAALALRASKNARIRQPLAKLVIAGSKVEALRPYLDLVADEVNVKCVELTTEVEDYASFRLNVQARVVGPRLGAETKAVIAASKRGEWSMLPSGSVEVAGHTLEEGEFFLGLAPRDGVACASLPDNTTIVVLDLTLTPELEQEGLARDVVRVVQQARKAADLHVADRIRLRLDLPNDEWRRAADHFRDYIAAQTLAAEIDVKTGSEPSEDMFRHESSVGSSRIAVELARIQ